MQGLLEKMRNLFKKKEHNTIQETSPGKKRKNKKAIIAAVVVAVILLGIIGLPKLLGGNRNVALLDLSDTTVLSYTDMEDSISATGTVESAQSTKVYSTSSYTVMDVYVEVGEYVEAGQLLAELDDQNIQEQITSQELSIAASERSSSEQIRSAKANYDNYKYGLKNDLNTSLNSAQSKVDSTLASYEEAKLTYERYLAGTGVEALTAESSLRSAQEELESAWDSLLEAKEAYNDAENDHAEIAEELATKKKSLDTNGQDTTALNAEIAQLEAALAEAKEDLNSAKSDLDAALKAYNDADGEYAKLLSGYKLDRDTLDKYTAAVDNAWKSYQEALTSLEATEKSTKDQLQSYANSLSSAIASANTDSAEESLRQLRVDLAGTRITAPCAGTVTAVYAEVGSSGSGLLFVIEDVNNLVVSTSVKGYDMGTVQTGMKVEIRSDATGDKEIEGVISSIAPTANKTSQGTTDTSGEAIFAAEVEITSQDTGLCIGMEAQLNYIIEEQSSVLAAPYDAVYENESGKTCVLAAIEQEDGKYLIREIEVKTGMDDDLDMVITGAEVKEGLRVINEPDTYLYLLGQTVTAGIGLNVRSMPGFPGGGQ